SFKAALVGIPLGGSSGVIVADPKNFNSNEIERMVRRYTTSIINVIGPLQDIIGPDINTDPIIMTWIADTYSMGVGHTVHRVCTGKPVDVGGIIGRDQGVGIGISYLLHELTRVEFEEIQNSRVVIQGLGHIGRNFMEAANKMGAKIIAVSDSKGGIFNLEGLDVSAVIAYKREHGHISDFPEAHNISNEEMLTMECDVLIPCAVPGQITSDIAKRIQCRRIIEGANAAITQEADKVLWDRIIPVIPDILANAGGIVVSYFEWTQNFTNHAWDIEEVHSKLKKIIVRTFHEVNDLRICEDITFREAAYMIAVKRLANAHKWRGIYP
ncbi:MAG: Glu/Leu/Phe/Val family dehydrogenase, partial [Promethearchaeota archaeon]